MTSPQTLSEDDRRLLALWAAGCAERVLGLFEAASPGDDRPRRAIGRARAFGSGDLATAEAIRLRFEGGAAARDAGSPAAAAAARAAGQAAAVCHMGAHALGAAGYAARAIGLAHPDNLEAIATEIEWQIASMTSEVRDGLRSLPMVGTDRSGPLGPGMLASGELGRIIRTIQRAVGAGDPTGWPMA